jgi:hypothetical protein
MSAGGCGGVNRGIERFATRFLAITDDDFSEAIVTGGVETAGQGAVAMGSTSRKASPRSMLRAAGASNRLQIINGHPRPLLFIALAALWVLYLLPAQIEPTHFVHDDSYFYVQIAANIVDGRGSTFHEITPTNGYHPLWMVVCVGALAVSGAEKILGLHIVALVQAVLLLATLIYFRRLTQLLGLRVSSPGIVLLADFFLSTALYASEAHLNAFTLTLGAYLLLAAHPRPGGGTVGAGIALGLAILARLDNIFIVAGLIASSLLFMGDRDRRALVGRTTAVVAPILLIVGGYLLHNYMSFGHLMPISGAIKSTFPEVVGRIGNLSGLGKLVSALAIVSILLSLFRRGPQPLRVVLAGFGVGVFAHSCYVVLFTDHYTFWSWYYVAGVLNMALLAALAADRVRRQASGVLSRKIVEGALALAVVLLALGGLGYGWAKALGPTRVGPVELPVDLALCRWPEQLGAWMKHNLPAKSGVLVYDWPGALAVHSDLRILPADGLINDFDYNAELPTLGAEEYLCRHDVAYYFGRRASQPGSVGPQRELQAVRVGEDWQELEIFTPLTDRSGGVFRVADADLVVRVRDIVDCPEETPDVAIWRLDFDCSR